MTRTIRIIPALALALILSPGLWSAPAAASLIEEDGCDVMELVEVISGDDVQGAWLVESTFTGETYTYAFEGAYVVLAFAPDGLTGETTGYVSWTLEELGAKGTNRTVVMFDLQGYPWPFTFSGQIIRGTRFPAGGIGGSGTYDPVTGNVDWTEVTLVFCQGHR